MSAPSKLGRAPVAPPEERRTIQSVERALDILEALATAADDVRLNDIARATRLNISTCHHLVATLVERGYVAQNPRGRAYHLGDRALALCGARARRLDLIEMATPALRALSQSTGETVHLDVLRGAELMTLARLDSPIAPRVASGGVTLAGAIHAAATGKSILAWLPDSELARLAATRGLPRFTAHTITDPAALAEELRQIRLCGVATDREESQAGVVGVAAAIRDHAGAVIGAFGCAMPTLRASEAQLATVRRLVAATAADLSGRLDRGAATPSSGAGV